MTDTSEFPIGFPWDTGTPLLDAEHIDGAIESGLAYERRVDHCAAGLELLLGQFIGKPRLRALACGLLDGVQDVEGAIWQLFTERWIDTGVGAQLDAIGTVLDFPRGGRLDETYRAFLRARVLVLRSDGSWPALLAILEGIGLALASASVTYEADHPAAFIARVRDTLPEEVTGADVFQMLEAARLAGVRLTLVAPVTIIERTLRFCDADDSPVTDTGRGLGDASNPGDGGAFAGVHASSVEV